MIVVLCLCQPVIVVYLTARLDSFKRTFFFVSQVAAFETVVHLVHAPVGICERILYPSKIPCLDVVMESQGHCRSKLC